MEQWQKKLLDNLLRNKAYTRNPFLWESRHGNKEAYTEYTSSDYAQADDVDPDWHEVKDETGRTHRRQIRDLTPNFEPTIVDPPFLIEIDFDQETLQIRFFEAWDRPTIPDDKEFTLATRMTQRDLANA